MQVKNKAKDITGTATEITGRWQVEYIWTDYNGEVHEGKDIYDTLEALHKDWEEM